jgi:alpha-tubulin suppressor-like RCC1 family protein
MHKSSVVYLIGIALVVSIILFTISARGCPKRSKNKYTGSSGTFTINVPSNLIATAVSPYQIDLSWQDNSNNDDGFEIERAIGSSGGIWVQIGTVERDITFYTDSQVNPFTLYYYRVRAFNFIGDRSNYSTEASASSVVLNWINISAGVNHTVALSSNNNIWIWGGNNYGQLGLGDITNRLTPVQVETDSDWQQIASGDAFTVAIKNNGTIWAWGYDGEGQMGNGSADEDALFPIQTGSDSDWDYVTAGYRHILARKTNSTIWVWGYNYSGQLGFGDTIDRYTPTAIGTGSDWAKIDAGGFQTAALKTNGTIWVWGANWDGQLSLGYKGAPGSVISLPTQNGSDSDWADIETGGSDTTGRLIALKTNNTLWLGGGRNIWGQLGMGDQIDRFSLTQLGTNSDWSKVATGPEHTIALKTNNTLWSWGRNNIGQLGLGDSEYVGGLITNRLTPTQIGTGSDWLMIKTFGNHSVALKNDSSIWLWGQNYYGQLGIGDTINRIIPIELGAPNPPASLSATTISSTRINLSWIDRSNNENGFEIERKPGITGAWAIIATVASDNTSYSDNDLNFNNIYYYRIRAYNNIGKSIYSNEVSAAATIIPPSNLKLTVISASQIDLSWLDNSIDETEFKIERKATLTGTYEQIAIVSSNITSYYDITATEFAPNTTYYYRIRGYNDLGDGFYSDEVHAAISGNWLNIKAGCEHSLGLKNNSSIWSSGNNVWGQLGLGDVIKRLTFTQIGSESDWSAIMTGGYHNIARKTDKTIWLWGYNADGQLGLGDTINKYTPIQIDSEASWSIIAGGNKHTICLKTNGTLWAWGNNDCGQLGLGDSGFSAKRLTPTQIGTDSDWFSLDAGGLLNVAQKNDGTIWSWGNNAYGQLGIGDTINRNSPTQIGDETDWSIIITGGHDGNNSYHFCTFGIKTNKTLWAWGNNSNNQLGLGDSGSYRMTPSQVGVSSDWVAVENGLNHTLGIKIDGTVWGWGANYTGQLGLGDTIERITPTQIGSENDWSGVSGGGSWIYHQNQYPKGFSLARKNNGTIWAWGRNDSGQLGLGDTINRNVPTLVGE